MVASRFVSSRKNAGPDDLQLRHRPDVLGLGADHALHQHSLAGALVVAPDLRRERSLLGQRAKLRVLGHVGLSALPVCHLSAEEDIAVHGGHLHPHTGVDLRLLFLRRRRFLYRFFFSQQAKQSQSDPLPLKILETGSTLSPVQLFHILPAFGGQLHPGRAEAAFDRAAHRPDVGPGGAVKGDLPPR